MANNPPTNPRWWNNDYDTSWKSARDTVRRDWSTSGTSGVSGTPGTSGAPDWDEYEPGVRYGYGAARQYSTNAQWDDKLEAKLKEEWNDLKSGRTWDEMKNAVRRGWDAARGRSSARSP